MAVMAAVLLVASANAVGRETSCTRSCDFQHRVVKLRTSRMHKCGSESLPLPV